MHLAVQETEIHEAEVYYLPKAHEQKAQIILKEVKILSRQALSLDVLSIYHQELVWLVKNFPPQLHSPQILPELKSYRLAFACRIEFLQTPLF